MLKTDKFQHQRDYLKFPQSLYHGDKVKLVNESLGQLAGHRLLDIGCGSVPWKWPGNEVTGLEADERIVAQLKAESPPAMVVKGMADEMPFADGYFDAVLMLDVIEHLNSPNKTMEEVRRVLKKGGLFLVFTPNFASLLWQLFEKVFYPFCCAYHDELYTEHVFNNKPQQLKTFLSGFFKVEQLTVCSYTTAVFVVCRKA